MSQKMESAREWLNPFTFLGLNAADFPHVTLDPSMRRRDADYYMLRGSGGDGTLIHTVWAMEKALFPILLGATCHKRQEGQRVVGYRIGLARVATLFKDRVPLRCGGEYPGQLGSVGIPVVAICEPVVTS